MSTIRTSAQITFRRKLLALLASGLVLGVGTTVTLAAWTDTEWVFGGNAAGNAPGIGTSVFEIQQNVTAPHTGVFSDVETNPGSALTFAPTALALSPGSVTYAPVALRTSPTSIAGTVTLRSAVAATGITVTDTTSALFGALTLRVAVSTTQVTCGAAAFTAGTIIANGPLATAGATASQTLAAAGGSTAYYCFEITLPASPTLPNGVTLSQLQGRTAAPAWQFTADSV